MNEFLSKKITFLKLLATFAVIFLHAYNYDNGYLKPYFMLTGTPFSWGRAIELAISNSVTRFAVPLFFMLSGFLFFNRFSFTFRAYLAKMKRRFFSLGLVFILNNIVVMIIGCTIYHLAPPDMFWFIADRRTNLINATPLQAVGFFFSEPMSFQLWFLRDLFLLCLFSPLIYFLVKYGKVLALILALGFWGIDKNIFDRSERAHV